MLLAEIGPMWSMQIRLLNVLTITNERTQAAEPRIGLGLD
ncbi:hypothetical protein LC55x_5436 [Lysobacter capsici]|nr:hypothetical protein LC55x_5436 [Lysobacter capsici]